MTAPRTLRARLETLSVDLARHCLSEDPPLTADHCFWCDAHALLREAAAALPDVSLQARLEKDCRARAKVCADCAEEYRRDGREFSRQFHLGAEMAFTDMADRLAGEAAAALPDEAHKCVIGEYCRTHGFIHGAEAEELRERFEKLRGEADHEGHIDEEEIGRVLDDVDARDSCAFIEAPKATDEAHGTGWQPPKQCPKCLDHRDIQPFAKCGNCGLTIHGTASAPPQPERRTDGETA